MPDNHLGLQIRDGAYPGEKVLVLDGVLNMQTVLEFRDFIRQQQADTLVLDMSNVRYIDSSGLGALIGAYVSFEQKYKRLLLAGANDRIWSVFRTSKVEDVFTRYHSVDEAERTVPAAN
jgi:anti-anti-sigma factor